MGKGQRNRDNRILRQPQVSEHPTTPKMISLLDKMEDGREYESIVKLKNVSWQLNEELKHSISEIESIRQRPLICYMANVLNRNITQSTSIDNLDDVPFLEMLRNVPENKNGLDIILVTPGGSAETVNYFVNQIRSRFNKVAFILPYMCMSAGTIFCMSGDELIMDDSSFIGPIDPQVISKEGRFVPAQAIFKLIEYINQRGMEHLKRKEPVDWTDVQLLGSIDAREIGVAINASKLSTDLVAQYLEKYKFKNWIYHDGDKSREVTEKERKDRALDIANQLCDHSLWLSHANRITRQIVEERCRLEIIHPEEINGLERAIKRFWALMCYSFETTPLSKVFASSNYMLFHSQPERINRG